jgi:8-oxo-dGTP pyrophosphatase MutT (NUDIX family)
MPVSRLPEHVAVPLSGVSFTLAGGPHPFETENLAAIDRNWQTEIRAKPRLFDGQVAMFGAHELRDGHLSAKCHLVRFATFLYWRTVEPVEGAEHFFAHAVPVARDNSLIAIRMGNHTANAGQVYFAAGSFDTQDFCGGKIDIEANMAREVFEETGIDLGAAIAEPDYAAWRYGGQAVIFRRYRFDLDAKTITKRIARHIQSDPDPEIDCAMAIRGDCALPVGLTSYMPGIIGWHFANSGPAGGQI